MAIATRNFEDSTVYVPCVVAPALQGEPQT